MIAGRHRLDMLLHSMDNVAEHIISMQDDNAPTGNMWGCIDATYKSLSEAISDCYHI